jgi:MarR family transcriptional regulator, organic hydroperoxide resistance regulator
MSTADGASPPETARYGPVSHAIFRVARLHRMLAGQLFRSVGLHVGQEIVMMHLWAVGPQRQADLIKVTDSDAAAMTRTVQRLEHAGFVRRIPAPNDKRAHLIEPTPASLALRDRVEALWAALERATVGDLDEAARNDALRSLERLESNLERAAAATPGV